MSDSTIVIALSIDDENLKPIYEWSKKYDWSSVKAVHFIHVVKIMMTPLEFGFLEVPDAESFDDMSPDLNIFLKNEAKKILPKTFLGEVICHVERSFTPQDTIKELIEETHGDVLVVGHVERHGLDQLFHSSFTSHMLKNSPCNVLVVR